MIADPDIDPDTARRILHALDVELVFPRHDWGGPEVVAVVVTPERQIREEDLARCPQVKLALTTSTGVDNIDVDACRRRNVAIWHPRDYCSDEVADTTIALLLDLLRGTTVLDRQVAAGNWHFAAAGRLQRIADARLGILGFGTIGQKVAIRACALGMRVAAHDPGVRADTFAKAGVRRVGLEELFHTSTAISIHVPFTTQTRGLVSERLLALLSQRSVLVNVARGEIVDVPALLARLDDGSLAAAALDVLPVEPPTPDAPAPRHPRLIVTPHAAWYSERSARTLFVRPLEVIRDFLLGLEQDDLIT